MGWYKFEAYVPVAERKRKATKAVAKLKKKGQLCQPIIIERRIIANTFWGKAWCQHLESYSDYENRLPRGRTYVRNGSVIDLHIGHGKITALVSGSSIYKVEIAITKVAADKWNKLVDECAGKIDSLIELLQGRFSNAVMQIITDPEKGLFPAAEEIELSCSCLDWAEMCKHAAAVLYGVGARLDDQPEALFLLRQVDYDALIAKAGTTSLTPLSTDQSEQIIDDSELSTLFSIDMGDVSQNELSASPQRSKLNKLKKKKISKKPNKIVKAAAPTIKVAKKSTKKSDRK